MPLVLVWLDAGHSESTIRTLLADAGDDVFVATWDPATEDGGRTALLASVREARDRITAGGGNPDELIIVGFGRGGVAAAGLTRYAKRLGIGLGRVIAVAGAWDEPDPFSGTPIEDIPERVEFVPDDYLLATTLRRT